MATTAPLTPSRFGTSMSYGANSTSMADSLPTVDFGFEELRNRMTAFTARFDAFIAHGRKRVLEERNAFLVSAAEIQETQRLRRQAIEDVELKSASYAEKLVREAQESHELQSAVQQLGQEKDEQENRRQELQKEVDTISREIKQRREAQQTYQDALDIQAREDIPELQAWESLLGLRIEGAKPDTEKLRFVFQGIDSMNKDREAWFEMDFADGNNKILATKPQLSREDVMQLENDLGISRDIAQLLKSIRDLFARSMIETVGRTKV